MTAESPKPIRQTRSAPLRAFLQDWLEWAVNGAPNSKPYFRGSGLCSSAPEGVLNELKKALKRDFGDYVWPFGAQDYLDRCKKGTNHECPKRLAWVSAKLGAPL